MEQIHHEQCEDDHCRLVIGDAIQRCLLVSRLRLSVEIAERPDGEKEEAQGDARLGYLPHANMAPAPLQTIVRGCTEQKAQGGTRHPTMFL